MKPNPLLNTAVLVSPFKMPSKMLYAVMLHEGLKSKMYNQIRVKTLDTKSISPIKPKATRETSAWGVNISNSTPSC